MDYIIHLEKLTLSPLEEEAIGKKLSRLEKLLTPPYVVHITLEHDRHHQTGDVITCRLTIEHGKHVWHAERTGGSVADAVDDAIAALKQELNKHHDKNISQKRESQSLAEDIAAESPAED